MVTGRFYQISKKISEKTLELKEERGEWGKKGERKEVTNQYPSLKLMQNR